MGLGRLMMSCVLVGLVSVPIYNGLVPRLGT